MSILENVSYLKLTTTAILLLLAVARPAYSAKLSIHTECSEYYAEAGSYKGPCLELIGEIDKETVDKAISLSKQLEVKLFAVNSGGGDVEEAIRLGKYMRNNSVSAKIVGTCASSCVLLYAAAVRRSENCRDMFSGEWLKLPSNVGVHRPFSVSDSLTTKRSAGNYERINNMVRAYLHEMNINESLLDLMNSTDPTSVKWLSRADKCFYFPEADPVWLDTYFSAEASRRGISKAGYIRERQRIKLECGPILEEECPEPKRGQSSIDWLFCNDDQYNACISRVMKDSR